MAEAAPRLDELDRVARQARRLQIDAAVVLPDREVRLRIDKIGPGPWVGISEVGVVSTSGGLAETVGTAMLLFARKWPRDPIDPKSVTVMSKGSPVKGAALKRLVLAAWGEAWDRAGREEGHAHE